MATQQKAPIYVSQDVWDEVDDMSDVLRKWRKRDGSVMLKGKNSAMRSRAR